MKAILALSALVCVSGTTPTGPAIVRGPITATIPSPFSASFAYVPRLDCGRTRGSAVRISDDILITATHVIDGEPCTAFGKPTEVVYRDTGRDFAALRANLGIGLRAVISCEGIREGRRYTAMGYPDGDAPASEPLIGTGSTIDGYAILRGKIYHGMSGGAVVDEGTGAIVAINNAMPKNGKPLVYVTQLRDTYLCSNA